ncbi:unnamed protein product [Spirodela intermedia]|uniref:Uncharacterized protein n=1 Tax=Spirodela intermedia TaxID=51605 RepID=A0A7I8IJ88_SPIIN|nr:unnamed protein product [Spirodela intermedia]CAA6657810.1 unnamed protein product [Spirodela intermedia]
MEDGAGGARLHVVMLPWLALGHIIPFFELSKRIACKGHHVSFVSTPRNLLRLPRMPPRLAPLINLVDLLLPQVDELPRDAEATIDLTSQELRPYLRKAYDELEGQLCRFLEEARSPPVDWIVFDYAPYWVPESPQGSGPRLLRAAVGVDGGRRRSDDAGAPDGSPEWISFPSTIAFRGFEARELFRSGAERDISGVSEAIRFGVAISDCQVVAVRSCPELEPNWLNLLTEIYRKTVVPVGLLPPVAEEGPTRTAASGGGSSTPFLWAFRRPSRDDGEELEKLPFPEGFEERLDGRGLVCEGWLPQVRILAHRAVAGFLTHGGWNSVVEGLSLGRAIILLPLMFDQGLNARDLVERGIGVEVPRDEVDGSFTADGISQALRLVMASPEGGPIRSIARESKATFGDEELHDEHLTRFIEYLVEHRRAPP